MSRSQYFRETILNEIRKARELYTGVELAAELSRIQQRLDNVECLSVDIVINLLLTYRDIQVRLLCAPPPRCRISQPIASLVEATQRTEQKRIGTLQKGCY